MFSIDEEKLNEKIKNVEINVDYASKIIDETVSSYTCHLDTILAKIYTDIIEPSEPAPIEVIEKYFLTLSNNLYFVGEKVEKLGIYDSISKSVAKEAFNNFYMSDEISLDEKGKKRTVAELTALSENASIYEQTVNDIYNKVYKIVKAKISSAENMCSALSKILSRRMSEMQLSAMQPATFNERKILNEGEMF